MNWKLLAFLRRLRRTTTKTVRQRDRRPIIELLERRDAPAAFTPGDLVIYRIGTGSASLTSAANAVFLDEYTPSGTLVQSVALPTTASGSNHRLVASGTATSEGLLTRSTNGQYLVLTGYDAAVGTASVAGTASTTVARVVGLVGVGGGIDTSTALTDFSNANNPRSAISSDGTSIWVGGAAGGVRYTTDGSTTSTQLSTTVTNIRQVEIFNGQLYESDSSGSTIRIGTVGSGLPTTTGQTITNLPGFETSTGSPYNFFFADLNPSVAGVDTLYVAEDTAGTPAGQIQKYSLVGGNWTANGTIAAAAIRGLTGVVNGTTVTLFGTTGGSGATGGGSLYTLTDTSGYNATITGSLSTIATAASNEAFRGVALAPDDTPVLSAFGGSINYNAGSAATIISSGVTLTDNSASFAIGNLTVSLTAGGESIDRLEINNQGTGSGQIGVSGSNVTYGGTVIGTFAGGTDGSTPLVVTFTSSAATPAAVQALMEQITFRTTSSSPSNPTRTVQFVVNDGDSVFGTSNTVSKTINVNSPAPNVVSINRADSNPTNSTSVDWTVTFDQSVTGVDTTDFVLATSSVSGASITGVSGSGTSYTVTVSTGSGDGTVGLNLVDDDSIVNGGGIPLGGTGTGNGNFTGQVYTIDKTTPTVSSINRADSNPTSASSVHFTVTFSEAVTGVDSSDFTLAASGVSGDSITNISGSGSSYTVTVDTGSGDGTLGLNLVDDDSITDLAGNPLGGPGSHNGDFTGQVYTVEKSDPIVSSINRADSNPSNADTVHYTVTFSQSVTGVDSSDFVLATSSGRFRAAITDVSGSGDTYTVTVSTGSGDGTLGLNLVDDDSIVNGSGIPLGGTGTGNGNFTGQVYTIDKTPPTVSSINLADSSPTNASTVHFAVTFSESVTGVDSSDFALAASGVSGAAITNVSGSGSSYTVTVSTGSSDGTLGLNLVDDDSITDLAGNPLGGTGADNGDFTGQVYTIDKTAPTVSSINRADANPTNASTVHFTVIFSEPVSGVDKSDFSLAASGVSGASISSVSGSTDTYTVTVTTDSGDGTLGLNLVDDDSITDAAGNPLGGAGTGNGNFTGQVYNIRKTPPVVSSINRADANPTTASTVHFTVIFSEAVSGVDSSDFVLAASGVSGSSITNVSGSGSSYTVTVSTGTGAGTLGLNLVDDDSIADAAGNLLGGTGSGNGNFTGQIYTIVIPVAFTPGDLVIYRVGDGSGSLVNTGNAVFLDEYTPSGTLVQTIPLPSVASGSNNPLIASGTASSEGLLTLSTNGQYLVLTGYDALLGGSASLSGTTSTAVPREVGLVGVTSSIDTTTALTNWASGNNPRSAVSTDGTSIWVGGAAGGVGYTTDGSTTYTQLSTTVTNIRQVEIFNGQLYESDSSGSAVRIGTVGTGLPTTSGQTITNLPGFETSTGSPYSFFLATLNAGDTSSDTLYVAEDTASGGQIQKYSLVSGSWTANGTIAATAIRGLTGVVNGTSVTLYGTTGASGAANSSSLYAITDTSGYNATMNGSLSTIATAATNEAFRGVAFAPDDTPVLSSFGSDVDYNAGSAAVILSNSVTLTDHSFSFIRGSLTVSLSAGGESIDRLEIHNQGTDNGQIGVSGNVVSYGGTEIGTFSGGTDGSTPLVVTFDSNAATPAAVQALMEQITFRTASASANNPTRTVQFVVNDGDPVFGTSNTVSKTINVSSSFPTVVSINRADANPTNAGTVHFTVTFSEDVSGVDPTDFVLVTSGVSGASISNVSGNGSSYTVTVSTGSGDGSLGLNLVDDDSIMNGNGAPLGGAGTGNGNFTGQVYTLDKTAPTVSSIDRADSDPTNAGTVHFTVTFSEAVTGVDSSDFALAASGVSGDSITNVSGSGSSYTVTVSTGSGDGTLGLNLVDDDSITDAAGNALGGAGTGNGNFTGQVYTIDKTAPTVSSIILADGNPTNADTVHFTVTFSEAVTGVDSSDFTLAASGVSGDSISNVSGSGSSYTVTVSTGSGDGTLGLNLVDDDSITDAAGNALGGAGTGNGNFTGQIYTIDKTSPTVSSINRADSSPTNATSVHFTVTFSEAVTGVDSSDFALAASGVSGASITNVSGSGGSYTVTVSTGSGDGTLGLNLVDDDSITDAAGNALGGAGTGNGNFTGQVYTIDKTAPTVSSIILADGNPTNADTVHFTVTFSEAVTGVDSNDFALATSGVSGASITNVSGSGSSYTVTVSTGSGSGTLGLNLVDDDSITDAAGNALGGAGTGNGDFTGQVYTIDKTAPTVSSINRADSNPTNAGTVHFTVTFSKSVTGVDSSDFVLAASGVSGASISNVSGNGSSYTVTVSTGSGDGTLGLNLVDDDSIMDADGNKLGGTGTGNGNFTGQVYTIDKTAPTVSSIILADGNPTNATSVHFTVTFSEAVTGVDSSDFTLATSGVSGASISNVSGSGSSYTVTVSTGSGDGTLGLNLVDDDSITDAAGNALGGAARATATSPARSTPSTRRHPPFLRSIAPIRARPVPVRCISR